MSRHTILIVLGCLVALSPYAGIPLATLGVILPILGLLIALIGASYRALARRRLPEVVVPYEAPEA